MNATPDTLKVEGRDVPDIFRSSWVPFYAQLNLIDPLFLQKKVSLFLISFRSKDNLDL